MAVDKLIDSSKLDACCTAEANAIRAKTGGSSSITYDWSNSKGFADAIAAISGGGGGGGLSEVTLASVANKSQYVAELILAGAGITKQADHMYIMSITKKNKTDWRSDQFVAGGYSTNGGSTGIRYRNGSPASIPINTSYDAYNEIGDTYVVADVTMWEDS